jgi:threonine dehydratase
MIPFSWLIEADERITPYIRRTPLSYDPETGLYIKWENHQVTGSFKARGALNKVLTLEAWERQRGLVAASAGNHGQGLALAGKIFDAPVIIFASENASPMKLAAIRNLGASITLVPGGYGEAENAGLAFARESGATWVSPYNDGQVIAGQGTLGLEISRDPILSREPTAWVVPVGGGGLISGIALAIKGHDPIGAPDMRGSPGASQPFLIGAQSQASPFFHSIFHTGTQSTTIELASLADGLAGPVEDRSITIPIVNSYVDDIILVTEEEIEAAIAFAFFKYQEIIEGASAAALAAVLTQKVKTRPAVVIISGGNIQPELHRSICARFSLADFV